MAGGNGGRNDVPSNSEWGALRSFLAQNGWSQAQIDEALGPGPANPGRTMGENAELLRVWQHDNASSPSAAARSAVTWVEREIAKPGPTHPLLLVLLEWLLEKLQQAIDDLPPAEQEALKEEIKTRRAEARAAA